MALLLIGGDAGSQPATMDEFVTFSSATPQLPVRFEYPAGWQPEESAGSHERYAQVQVFGPASLEPRLRTYLVVRRVPPRAEGGRYGSLDEMVESYRATMQSGLHVDADRPVQVLGRTGRQLDISGDFRLSWETPGEIKSVPVKSQRIFVEQDGQFYELAWMATPEVADQVAAVFSRLLQTLTLVQ
ncbi:MAG: hypothetical protein HYT90_06085 [Candidatus Omnitrophica bacterium]|nr:hypothetical protein [Candidatus Omnitrophota bacterium]